MKTTASKLLVLRSLLLAAFFFSPLTVRLHAGAAGQLKELVGDGAVVAAPDPASPTDAAAGAPLKAWFVNVGQGDAEYIELPNGRNVLIDGGPAAEAGAGDPPIAQFLKDHKVSRIDYMVLTHPHADHYAGLQYVVDHMKVGSFYDTRMDNTGATMDDSLRQQISKSGTKVSYPSAGDALDWDPGEVQVKVLNGCSFSTQAALGQVLNDCSIVLKVTYRNTSILYTGDMQDDVEARLVAQDPAALKADVLKVGHHGSAHSSSADFLNAVKPKVAYIEVGQNNYGHPTPSCLSRLKSVGAAIYTTLESGTMQYTIGADPALADPSAMFASLSF